MIHSNSEGDIYIEEMPLLLVHLREEEKGAVARLSEVLSYAPGRLRLRDSDGNQCF